jgi:hypothetical protein
MCLRFEAKTKRDNATSKPEKIFNPHLNLNIRRNLVTVEGENAQHAYATSRYNNVKEMLNKQQLPAQLHEKLKWVLSLQVQ